ncbi:MAG: hypothetical protein AAF290_16530 [Pseudomonadota bacterium]
MNNTTLTRVSLAAVALLPIIAAADHAESNVKIDLDSGGYRESKSFKTNGFVYRSIGGNTTIKGEKKKRSWKCVWLCKKSVKKKVERIVLVNTYYSEVSPGSFVSSGPVQKTCEDVSSCTLKEWAVGFNISMQFPNGENGGGLLPIDGVITNHRMIIDGQQYSAYTAKGKHPTPTNPIVE